MVKELYAPLITIAGTMVLALIGALLRWWHNRAITREALFAEIASLLEIIEERHFIHHLNDAAADIEKGRLEEGRVLIYRVAVDEKYRAIYDAHLTKLGVLSYKETAKVVRFYQYLHSVVKDVTPEGSLYDGSRSAEEFRATAVILQKAVDLGKEILPKKH